jgi:hypothetical protein
MKDPLSMLRLVDTYEFSPLTVSADAEELKFRLEIFRAPAGGFVGKLYLHETYRIQAAFGSKDGEPVVGDHELLVKEDVLGFDDFVGDSADAVVAQVTKAIAGLFGSENPAGSG